MEQEKTALSPDILYSLKSFDNLFKMKLKQPIETDHASFYNYLMENLRDYHEQGYNFDQIVEGIISFNPLSRLAATLFNFKESGFIDEHFNDLNAKFNFNNFDVSKKYFGVNLDSPTEDFELYRKLCNKSFNIEGLIMPNGDYYFVGLEHSILLQWLNYHNVDCSGAIRTAIKYNSNATKEIMTLGGCSFYRDLNAKTDSRGTIIRITPEQVKVIAIIDKAVAERQKSSPNAIKTYLYRSEDLGFDNPQAISDFKNNLITINDVLGDDVFNYNEAKDILRERTFANRAGTGESSFRQ